MGIYEAKINISDFTISNCIYGPILILNFSSNMAYNRNDRKNLYLSPPSLPWSIKYYGPWQNIIAHLHAVLSFKPLQCNCTNILSRSCLCCVVVIFPGVHSLVRSSSRLPAALSFLSWYTIMMPCYCHIR